MKNQAQEFAAQKAVQQGFIVIEDADRVVVAKGLGVVFRWEVLLDGSKKLDGLEIGIIGGKQRHQDIEPAAF